MTTPTTHETTAPSDVSPTTRDVDPELTVRESALGTATVREPDASAATVREGETTTGRGSRSSGAGVGTGAGGFLRLPEGLAVRYRIERELPTRGNEADLFVVRPLADDDGLEVVVKLYRANVHPKDEVLTRIAALDGQHVIRQIEHGVSEGRSFEVIEYAAEGSLADLMRETRFDDAMLKAMIREVTAGLGYLHSLDPPIVHRDVKPDNILVRGREPLDLVLTDFGLSSVLEGGSWRASTLDRTIKYAAPEAGAGQVSREMDWWSLGMMVAEAASGRHPFAGVAEQTIGIHYSNRLPVPLDGIADERVKLLCQGLLCYDRKQRWGTDQVWRWIAGDTSLRPPVEETRQAAAGVPFKFAGGSYGTIRELAAAFAANWEAAQKTVARADGLLAWLKDEAKEYEAWQWLSEIAQDKAQLDPGLKVTLLLPMLDPNLPVMFEGQEFTQERLLEEVEAAAEGADSPRTARLQQLWDHASALAELTHSANWLREAQGNLERARKEASELITAMGPEAPQIAAPNTWTFAVFFMKRNADPGSSLPELEEAEALLSALPNDASQWIAPLKHDEWSRTVASWLMPQLLFALRELTAEIERRNAAELAARIRAEAEAARRKEAEAARKIQDAKALEGRRAAAELASKEAAAAKLATKLAVAKAATIARLESSLSQAGWVLTQQFGENEAVLAMAVSANSRHLATAGESIVTTGEREVVHLWDLSSGRRIRSLRGHSGGIRAVAFTPDGRYLLTASSDQTTGLWDIKSGNRLRIFTGHKERVTSVVASPSARYALTGSGDKTARLWDMATGRELHVFVGHTDTVLCVAFTPDEKFVVTGSDDASARIWELRSGREIRRYGGHTLGITSIAVAPDGQQIATGGHDTTIQLWNIGSAKTTKSFSGHTARISALAFTRDQQQLVSGSYDKTVRLWDLNSGLPSACLYKSSACLETIVVMPIDNLLLTGSRERGTPLKLWNLNTRTLLDDHVLCKGGSSAIINTSRLLDYAADGINSLFHFVRGMDVLTVDQILEDKGETWQIPPPTTTLESKESEAEILVDKINSSPAIEPMASEPHNEAADTGLRSASRLVDNQRTSAVSSLLKRLLRI